MPPAEKPQRILDAALPVFAQYGYARATMQDIAAAAGISRAALYQCFSSKAALFRAGAERSHREMLGLVRDALAGDAPPLDRIEAGLEAYAAGVLVELAASPHRAELFAAGRALSGDTVAASRADLIDALAAAIAAAERAGELRPQRAGLGPAQLAGLLLDGVNGTKESHPDPAGLRAGIAALVRLTGAALRP